MQYLEIVSTGDCPIEALTILGASTVAQRSAGEIGQFRTGFKFATATALRMNHKLVVCTASDRYDFGTVSRVISDGRNENEIHMVTVSQNKNKPRELGFTTAVGVKDWTTMAMALRELFANAIDSETRQGTGKLPTYRIVEETQIRRAKNETRVYVEYTDEVRRFVANLSKWFLHFTPEYDAKKTILEKKDRNLHPANRAAVIDLNGVRVREATGANSLFDYNLPNGSLVIDECRNANEGDTRAWCGRALMAASPAVIRTLLEAGQARAEFWEEDLPSFEPSLEDKPTVVAAWNEALVTAAGQAGVVSTDEHIPTLKNKGRVVVRSSWSIAAMAYRAGVPTYRTVLSEDDLEGRQVLPATKAVVTALGVVWDALESLGLTQGMTPPKAACFSSVMSGGSTVFAFYRQGCVYINQSIADSLSQKLIKATIEEIAHYVTKSGDCTRDLQDYAFQVAAAMMVHEAKAFASVPKEPTAEEPLSSSQRLHRAVQSLQRLFDSP